MDTWLDTVCKILAFEIGVSVRVARFMLNDWMGTAHEAYNASVPAQEFAVSLCDILPRR